jgi:hypothetical protein
MIRKIPAMSDLSIRPLEPLSSLLKLLHVQASFTSRRTHLNDLDPRLVSLHNDCHLFQTRSFRFGIDEEDDGRLDGEPDHVPKTTSEIARGQSGILQTKADEGVLRHTSHRRSAPFHLKPFSKGKERTQYNTSTGYSPVQSG